jgi:hypothetical protein
MASASVILGSSPSSTLATSSADGEAGRRRDRQPGRQDDWQERNPGTKDYQAINHATRLTCCSSGLSSRPKALLVGPNVPASQHVCL